MEAGRKEFRRDGVPNVDLVLTTQEVIKMIKESGIRFQMLEKESPDLPYGMGSGAAEILSLIHIYTPNCWAIYCCGKVFKYLKSIGGLEEMHKRNIEKAKVIYDFLDSSKMFNGTVEPEFRSLMNLSLIHICWGSLSLMQPRPA